jgi:hypothetical protein
VSAAAAYLDAKYHIRKDLANIREGRQIAKLGQKLGRLAHGHDEDSS